MGYDKAVPCMPTVLWVQKEAGPEVPARIERIVYTCLV
jgi:hypothetical protein